MSGDVDRRKARTPDAYAMATVDEAMDVGGEEIELLQGGGSPEEGQVELAELSFDIIRAQIRLGLACTFYGI